MAAGKIGLSVNGREIDADVPPRVVEGRIVAPVRFIAEALGADVKWDAVQKAVLVTRDNTKLELIVDGQALKNGQPMPLDVPAKIMGNRVMIPVRFVSQAFGCKVKWDEATGTVHISTRGGSGTGGAPPQGKQPQKEVLFTWEKDHGWEKQSGDGSLLENDTVNFRSGRQSVKLTGDKTECWAGKTFPADLLNKQLVLDIFVQDVTGLKSVDLVMDTGTNWHSYFGYSVPAGTLKNGWNRITLVPSAFYRLGAEPPPHSRLAGIKRWRIKLVPVQGRKAAVSFDTLQAVPSPLERGAVTLTFDDGYTGVYHGAKPIMDKFGFAGVAYVITDLVGAPGRMTVDQLKSLQDLGWDIASHTKGHKFLVSGKPADGEIESELAESQKWLVNNGFPRGSRHLSSPGGEFNDNVLSTVKKYYASHRTIMEEKEICPPADPYMLKVRNIINSTPVNAVKGWVDQAASNKEWLILVFHNITDPAEVETQVSVPAFQSIIDYIAAANVDVISMSAAIDGITR